MGEQCGLTVEVEFPDTPDETTAFWAFLKTETGGLPGQADDWRWDHCWTRRLNEERDKIGIRLTGETTELYLRTDERHDAIGRADRMLAYSRKIRELMGDQQFSGNEESQSKKGKSIVVWRAWDREDQDEWLEAAMWIKDQADRLEVILGGA